MQAKSLLEMIEQDVRKEGLVGMAIAGGALAVFGAVVVGAIQRARR